MPKLDKFKLFKSIIFNFFAVLLSFFFFFISTTYLLTCLLAALLLAAPVLSILFYCLTHLLSLFCTPVVFTVLNASIMICMYISVNLTFFCFFSSYSYILVALFVLWLVWVQLIVNTACTWIYNASRFPHLFMNN